MDHLETIKNLKKSKTCSCLNILRNRSRNKNIKISDIKTRNKTHNLSKINNKSSSCITPGYFNPFINYKTKENKCKNKKKDLFNKNKDHFYHMNPTELFKYKPLLKRNKVNLHSISQIEGLPGNLIKYNINQHKKTGKKLFSLMNLESKDVKSRNQQRNNIKYLSNTINILGKHNASKVFEYEAPAITYRDMNIKKN